MRVHPDSERGPDLQRDDAPPHELAVVAHQAQPPRHRAAQEPPSRRRSRCAPARTARPRRKPTPACRAGSVARAAPCRSRSRPAPRYHSASAIARERRRPQRAEAADRLESGRADPRAAIHVISAIPPKVSRAGAGSARPWAAPSSIGAACRATNTDREPEHGRAQLAVQLAKAGAAASARAGARASTSDATSGRARQEPGGDRERDHDRRRRQGVEDPRARRRALVDLSRLRIRARARAAPRSAPPGPARRRRPRSRSAPDAESAELVEQIEPAQGSRAQLGGHEAGIARGRVGRPAPERWLVAREEARLRSSRMPRDPVDHAARRRAPPRATSFCSVEDAACAGACRLFSALGRAARASRRHAPVSPAARRRRGTRVRSQILALRLRGRRGRTRSPERCGSARPASRRGSSRGRATRRRRSDERVERGTFRRAAHRRARSARAACSRGVGQLRLDLDP